MAYKPPKHYKYFSNVCNNVAFLFLYFTHIPNFRQRKIFRYINCYIYHTQISKFIFKTYDLQNIQCFSDIQYSNSYF